MKSLGRQLLYSPVAMVSVGILCVLYGGMFFAEFLSPYTPTQSFPKYVFHPPNLVLYSKELGFRPQVQKTVLKERISFHYVRIKHAYVKLSLFVRGVPYRLFGIVPTRIHLFGIRQEDIPDKKIPVFLFGSDSLGRDIFSRILYGSRISLTIGFVGIAISTLLAILIGGIAGYFGGWVDWFLMRFTELIMLIPSLYLILFLRSVLSYSLTAGQTFFLITIILSLVGWPGTARLVRGMVHSIKNEDFILHVQLDSVPALYIIFRHILPHLSSILIVSAALGIPGFILGETVLSYLGLGVSDPSVSWGLLLGKEITTLGNLRNFPWILSPGLYLLLATISYTFLGEFLRDYLDPYHIRVRNEV